MTLPDGSHPICLCLCLFPGANAAVYEAIVATRDGALDAIFAFPYRSRIEAARRCASCLWLHIYLKASEALLRNKFDFDPFAAQPKRLTSHLLPSVGACPSFILSRPHDPVLKRYD